MLNRHSLRAAVAAMAILFSAAFNSQALAAWAPGDLITYPQGMWSDDLTGLLFNNYDSVYSSSLGIVEAGIPGVAGFSIQFAAATYVVDYLPASGMLRPLNSDLMNPTSSSSGGFGGEILTLRLNIDFSDAWLLPGNLGIPFGDLQLRNFHSQINLNGLTVRAAPWTGQQPARRRLEFLLQHPGALLGRRRPQFFVRHRVRRPVGEDHLRVVYLPGDFQEDGDVDGADLTQWKAGFGMSVAATHFEGDSDYDGDVDGADFLIWQRQFGASIFASAPVPEPAAAGLALVGLVALARRRHRGRSPC